MQADLSGTSLRRRTYASLMRDVRVRSAPRLEWSTTRLRGMHVNASRRDGIAEKGLG